MAIYNYIFQAICNQQRPVILSGAIFWPPSHRRLVDTACSIYLLKQEKGLNKRADDSNVIYGFKLDVIDFLD